MLMKNGREIIDEISRIAVDVDSMTDLDRSARDIAELAKHVEAQKLESLYELNLNKNMYLDAYKDRFDIPSVDGVRPQSVGRHIVANMTSTGLVADSVSEMVDVSLGVWANIENLDSVEQFQEFIQDFDKGHEIERQVEDKLFEAEHPIPNRYAQNHHRWLAESFDNVGWDQMIETTNRKHNVLENNLDSIRLEYEHVGSSNTFEQFIQDKYGANYKEKEKDMIQAEIERFDDVRGKSYDVPRPDIADYQYSQLLFGIYDQDMAAVKATGLHDDFQRVLDKHVIDYLTNVSDTVEDMPADDVYKMLVDVGYDMGLARADAEGSSALLRMEDRGFVEDGLAYTSRAQEPFEVDEDIGDVKLGDWLADGYQTIYNQPMDLNADQYIHRQDNPITMDDQVDMDNSLMSVSLNASIIDEPTRVPHIQDKSAKAQMYDFVTDIYAQKDIAMAELSYEEHVFATQLDETSRAWDVTERSMTADPGQFVDLIGHTINQTLTALEPELYALSDGSDGYDMVIEIMSDDSGRLHEDNVIQFIDGYAQIFNKSFSTEYQATTPTSDQDMKREAEQSVLDDVNSQMDAYNEAVEQDDGLEL